VAKRRAPVHAKGPAWVKYSPAFAAHVRGRYTARVADEDGIPEEQKVEARCFTCDAPFKRTCSSGLVTQHIDRFARVHVGCAASDAALSTGGPNENEKAALVALRPLFQEGTKHFRHLARIDAPEISADVLTPQRCRALLAIVVSQLAPVYGIAVPRLDSLARQTLVLARPDGTWTPVHRYLERKGGSEES
jgi:hypothetical protein